MGEIRTAPIGSIELRESLLELWRRRLWILASTIFFLLLAAAYAFLSKPVYRSTTVLVSTANANGGYGGSVGSALGQLGGLATLAGLSLGPDNVDEALAVLQSRQFTERFLADNKLLPVLYAGLWDEADGQWRVAKDRQPTLARAFKLFDEKIRSIVQDKRTGLVSVNIDWHDPAQAASWANDLVARLNAEMRRRAIVQADASLAYLQSEFSGTKEVVARESIGRLMERQIQSRMLANVSPEYAFRVVDKAMPADPDDVFRPRRMVLLLGGTALGFGLGIIAVLLLRILGFSPP